ncbi:gamma-glutamylcyclotransferase family protein [Coraliomargarita parva]|uniref:gamma-glutamylcyclotransferase family protein n=1 Tax=Coraliomargarita parva TaxID=3014050 RepID=UPI0022B4959B|nr:gamma-glutamylcyclotransferase [Coraliomargarita parva]
MSVSEYTVFVYGTLKPGGRYWPRYCEGKVASPLPAMVRGELYDLHVGYPGLILRGDSWVQGFIMTFPEQKDFLHLDTLEDYQPGRPLHENEYNRLKVECFNPAGESFGPVWVYEMSEAKVVEFGGTRLKSGNWPI